MADFRTLSTLAVLGALSCAAYCQAPIATAPSGGAAAESPGDCYRSESRYFRFHSDPWINLHHFLFQWARNNPERLADDSRQPEDVVERADTTHLAAGERESWDRALSFYRNQVVGANLLFTRDLVVQRDRLALIACSGGNHTEVDSSLWSVLEAAMPIYKRHWWPRHHAANMAWISERRTQLSIHEEALAKGLADAYGGTWPPERVRVDVAAYASWSGAYTTNGPNHITVKVSAYPDLAGLEILFHEVSHASFFSQPMRRQLADAFGAQGSKPPDRLLHTFQFITPGELLRARLPAGDRAGFQTVGAAVLQRGRFRDQYEIVLKHWGPFLGGLFGRDEALRRIARDLSAAKP